MKISKEKAAENRSLLLTSALRLIKAHGIDGVGVADISKSAGLTHGALYAHFSSKNALIAEALSQNLDLGFEHLSSEKNEILLSDYLDSYLSIYHRDHPADGCPMAASASEISRQTIDISSSYTTGFAKIAKAIRKKLGKSNSGINKDMRSLAIVSALVGGVAIARATASIDPEMSNQILQSVRILIKDIEGEKPQRKRREKCSE